MFARTRPRSALASTNSECKNCVDSTAALTHSDAAGDVSTGCPAATEHSTIEFVMGNKDLSAHPESEGTVTPGLCRDCRNAKIMRSDRGSVFYRCMLSDTNPDFAKYPTLPVLNCSGWQKGEPQ